MDKNITVSIEEVGEKTMYMSRHLADGTLGEVEFDASLRLPDHSLIVTIKDKRYLVNVSELVRKVVEFHEATTK